MLIERIMINALSSKKELVYISSSNITKFSLI
jgi:hypothetical protein